MAVLDLSARIDSLHKVCSEGTFADAVRSLLSFIAGLPELAANVRLVRYAGSAPDYLVTAEQGRGLPYEFVCGAHKRHQVLSRTSEPSAREIQAAAAEQIQAEIPIYEAHQKLLELARTGTPLAVVVRFAKTPGWWIYEDHPFEVDRDVYARRVARLEEARQSLAGGYIDALFEYASSRAALEYSLQIHDRELFLAAHKSWRKAERLLLRGNPFSPRLHDHEPLGR